jgi:glyoxylase-like metal-dependent hydrolase (beta-lactamase superfamily II)
MSDNITTLNWEVFVTPGIPAVAADLAPEERQRMWSPISSTLIFGNHDAVLVDTFLTVDQANTLVDWVSESRKKLNTVYATHGHGDHFFGAGIILSCFSDARFVATPEVIKTMRKQASPEVLASLWEPRFPNQIPKHLAIAEELIGNSIKLEGHDLVAVPLGHTDTDNTTCLHVPSIGLVVAGDAVYNGVHLHLGESDLRSRQEWISGLDIIEGLTPRAVIAGHKRAGNDDNPRIIEETRRYIRNFDRIAATTATALDLYSQMTELYPAHINPGILWSSARRVKGES